jgi:hypothetical protein
MTPKTEKKVSKDIKEMKPERGHLFIMAMTTSVLYNVRLIGLELMATMQSITLVELKVLLY